MLRHLNFACVMISFCRKTVAVAFVMRNLSIANESTARAIEIANSNEINMHGVNFTILHTKRMIIGFYLWLDRGI